MMMSNKIKAEGVPIIGEKKELSEEDKAHEVFNKAIQEIAGMGYIVIPETRITLQKADQHGNTK